jgi:hypothetical protein
MTTAKKPTVSSEPATAHERQAQNFIASAHKVHRTVADKKPLATTLRFKPEFLQRIDAAAQRRNITRSAWIKSTLSQVLEKEEYS